jgi:hypothetical protein
LRGRYFKSSVGCYPLGRLNENRTVNTVGER